MSEQNWTVHNNAAQSRFEVVLDEGTALAQYRLHDGVMQIVHTEVPPALEGRGLASALISAAVKHARAEGLKIEPRCSYAASYMKRHPETQDLLA
jgi:predicted GNAT family acetyltransferase